MPNRRTITALVSIAAVVGGLAVAAPVASSSSGICSGVVNQLAHRGMVQENLLKAAARKNAESITKLQAEKAVLEGTVKTLTTDIASTTAAIAALDAEVVRLDTSIATATTELARLTTEQASTTTAIADAKAALADAQSRQADLTEKLRPTACPAVG